MRKGLDMKVTGRVALYFFGLFFILSAGDFHLWGEEDPLGNLGVHRFEIDDEAPEFTLPDLTGKNRSLSDFQGKFIMLNFWATW